jgi:hypothetical protein
MLIFSYFSWLKNPNRLCAGQPGNQEVYRSGDRYFPPFHSLQTLFGTHAASYVMGTGDLSLEKSGQDVKLLNVHPTTGHEGPKVE